MALYMLLSENTSLEKLAAVFSEGDGLLLLADGVYLLPFLAHYKTVYVRSKDLQQRGISIDGFKNAVSLSDEQWVELTLSQQPVVSLK